MKSRLLRHFALFAALSVTACDYRRGALDPVSDQALVIAILWWAFFWTSMVVFAGVLVALGIAFVRGRRRERREGADADHDPSAAEEHRTERVVFTATGVSALVLVGLLVASIASGRELGTHAEPALHVKVIAHQWWWEVQYPGPTAADLVQTANELHLPAGRTVDIELRSADVIHSLWMPNLQGKRDLIPGHANHLVIRAMRVGSYEGHCAEFCGLEHARMELPVTVEPEDRFSAWLEAARTPARVPADEAARRGGELFLRGPCALCHNVTGTDASASAGPDLTHVASRAWLAAGALPNSRENLRAWLADPQRVKPGAQMPATALPPAELSDVVTYLETLK